MRGGLLLVLGAAMVSLAALWAASAFLVVWLVVGLIMPDIQKLYVDTAATWPGWLQSPGQALLIALVLFLPAIMGARLCWSGMERVLERGWDEQWSHWQAWKQRVMSQAR